MGVEEKIDKADVRDAVVVVCSGLEGVVRYHHLPEGIAGVPKREGFLLPLLCGGDGIGGLDVHLPRPAIDDEVDFVLPYRMLSGGVRFQAGDTVIARIEPCLQNGKKFYCKDIVEGFGSTEFIVFRPKNGAVDNVFLYYYMQLHNVRERMIQSMTGATGRQRVNPDIFKDIFIDIPSRSSSFIFNN